MNTNARISQKPVFLLSRSNKTTKNREKTEQEEQAKAK